jgi:hypothetical protein
MMEWKKKFKKNNFEIFLKFYEYFKGITKFFQNCPNKLIIILKKHFKFTNIIINIVIILWNNLY